MNRWIFIVLFFLFQSIPDQDKDAVFSKYRQAMDYYESSDPTDFTDSMALAYFKEIIYSKNTQGLKPEIVLDIYEKSGNLSLIKGELKDAVYFYREGLKIREIAALQDSLFFATNLFLGETYYLLSQADSSIYFLENAEKLLSKNSSNTERSRLFNSLGVIYFESGNYIQSINYFNKAKNLSVGDKSFDELEPYYQYALFSFLNNIGSSLLQLKQLDSALSIYREIEKSGLNKDQVNTQIASIFLKKNMPDSSLYYLDKIKSEEYRQSASFQNQLAEIYLIKNDYRKAKSILESFIKATVEKDNFSKDFRLGRSYRLLGKIAFEEGDFQNALGYFQNAIIQIDGLFNQSDVFTNPEDFSLGFATFSLIESLVDKARSFIKLYQENNDPRFLEAGITTFQTAFDMAFYVSNYYDNDEARIFLGDFVLDTYQDAVEILLGQFQKSNDSQYLHKAFQWAERSKSTSLNIGIREKGLKKVSGISQNKLNQERDLQFAISKMQQAILSERNLSKVNELQLSLTDKRLELSRLHQDFYSHPDYMNQKLNSELIDISVVQKELLDSKTIILSFFETRSQLILFALTRKNFELHVIEKTDDIVEDINGFKKNLIEYRLGQKYLIGSRGYSLFGKLFGEIESQMEKYSNFLIIPHGLLIDLPFEVIEKKPGDFLINDHAITYQYSMQLLDKSEVKEIEEAKTFGFAPFFEHTWSDEQVQLSKLPYSKAEVDFLKGDKFFGTKSSKNNLLEVLPSADYVQLSTHAIPDPQNPDLAFIAFYPGNIENRLYTNEVVNLDLSHTSLVFLSACETNFGYTSRSEGVLSISRAFMLAGCQNIISSLWKAEDKATTYITAAFYKYLESGETYTESLRKAKLEFLSDPQMAQYQHPVFWSHLVLLGDIIEPKSLILSYSYQVLLLILLICFGSIYLWRNFSFKSK